MILLCDSAIWFLRLGNNNRIDEVLYKRIFCNACCVDWKENWTPTLYFSAANGSRWRTGDSIMQSGRIYIGMMFSPVESVSTWPDAPFKYVYARLRESRHHRPLFSRFRIRWPFNSHCDDWEFVSTAADSQRYRLEASGETYKCIEAVTKWNYVNRITLKKLLFFMEI